MEGGAEQTDEGGRERWNEDERESSAGSELVGVRRHVCECTSLCLGQEAVIQDRMLFLVS